MKGQTMKHLEDNTARMFINSVAQKWHQKLNPYKGKFGKWTKLKLRCLFNKKHVKRVKREATCCNI